MLFEVLAFVTCLEMQGKAEFEMLDHPGVMRVTNKLLMIIGAIMMQSIQQRIKQQ